MRRPKTFRVAFGATVLMCVICWSEVLGGQEKPILNAPSEAEYHIAARDVLQIAVYQHPEVSKTVVVDPDGSITLPLLNTVKVAGLSVSAVADLLRNKLEPMLSKPQVTVILEEIHHFIPPNRARPPLRDIPAPDDLGCCIASSDAPKVLAS
jgi:Polysaccharide biosynthesis/export protein